MFGLLNLFNSRVPDQYCVDKRTEFKSLYLLYFQQLTSNVQIYKIDLPYFVGVRLNMKYHDSSQI